VCVCVRERGEGLVRQYLEAYFDLAKLTIYKRLEDQGLHFELKFELS